MEQIWVDAGRSLSAKYNLTERKAKHVMYSFLLFKLELKNSPNLAFFRFFSLHVSRFLLTQHIVVNGIAPRVLV